MINLVPFEMFFGVFLMNFTVLHEILIPIACYMQNHLPISVPFTVSWPFTLYDKLIIIIIPISSQIHLTGSEQTKAKESPFYGFLIKLNDKCPLLQVTLFELVIVALRNLQQHRSHPSDQKTVALRKKAYVQTKALPPYNHYYQKVEDK